MFYFDAMGPGAGPVILAVLVIVIIVVLVTIVSAVLLFVLLHKKRKQNQAEDRAGTDKYLGGAAAETAPVEASAPSAASEAPADADNV